jgi:hypothetical protein
MPPLSLKLWWNAMLRRAVTRRTPRRPTEDYPAPPILATVESAQRLFGRLSAKHDLVATARAQISAGLEAGFRRYVDWLDRAGYAFGSCEEIPLRFDARRIYLRYDVHVRDLFGAFVLADLHERLQIPGSFQICWEHTQSEAEVSDIFLKLQAFDGRFVQFGLHCSPESSWLIADRFAGRAEGLDAFVASGGSRGLMAEWLAAFERDGHDAPILAAARCRADACLADTVVSFRRHFGPVATISGHGTPLATDYLEAARAEPRLGALAPYLHSVEFLDAERVRRHGFARELTRFNGDRLPGPVVMFENPADDMAQRYAQRLSGGGGFVALFHPATWTGDHLAPFIDGLSVPEP